jgi:GNAT superfamily N-acetyltransferase
MDTERCLQLNRASLEKLIRTIAAGSEGARLLERDGVIGVVAPAVPQRSVFNSVVYDDAGALAAARDELAAEFEAAGCAWTVWAPERDTEAAALLESAGHRLDGAPRAMAMELEGLEEPDLSGLDWTGEGEIEPMGRINDLAYGYPVGTFAAGLGPDRHDDARIYLAAVDGEPAATVMTLDEDEDCGIYCVATLEQARGKGLCAALMRQAAWEGRRRGCATATLQATRMGAPVYERVGYGDHGAIEMWEYRS